MSGIAGLFALDGSSPDTTVLDRMMAALAHRGPDGAGAWTSGPVALGHRMLRATPEAATETQPWRDGALAVALDGRIDNREPLRAALEAKGRPPRAEHDAELVLRAYECWGEGFARELVGDFAIAVWDGRHRRLCCARDPLGVRPFYYHWDGRTFRWSSEPQALLEDPAVGRIPNEAMVAEMLAGYLVSREETLWQGITRLAPGHTLTLDAAGCRAVRYWPSGPPPTIRYASDAEYAEHFRALLEEAVRARLRAPGPVGAHLSGGIDSSSVVALGQRLVHSGAATAPSLESFSQTYSQHPDDVEPFAEAVVRHCGVKAHFLPQATPGPSYYEAQARRYLDFPDYPNGAAASEAMNRRAANAGCRVMLTGIWGNAFLEGSVEHVADLLREGHPVAAIRRARRGGHPLGSGVLSVLLGHGLRPLIPRPARRALSRLLRRPPIPDFVPDTFARRVALRDRLRQPGWVPPYPTLAQRAVYRMGCSAWNIHAGEITERGAARHGIEERHPFADRRLVEFCLALPETQRWRGPTVKFVLREAMRGLVPERVRVRRDQPDYSFLLMDVLEAAGGERLFNGLTLAERGWVDEPRVRTLYRQAAGLYARGAPAYAGLAWPLWTIWGLDLWLRASGTGGAPCR